MNSAFQLLTELSTDPFYLEAFLRNPDPLIGRVDMVREDPGTWARCATCTDPGYDPLPDPDVPAPAPSTSWARCATCTDPGYDPLPDPDVPAPSLSASA